MLRTGTVGFNWLNVFEQITTIGGYISVIMGKHPYHRSSAGFQLTNNNCAGNRRCVLSTRSACCHRSLFFGITMLLALFISGCTTTTTTAPFYYSNNSNYDFIILGEVTYESSSKTGFQELLRAARSKYKDCDYVIDIMIDSQTTITTSLLSFLFPTRTSTTYTMRGKPG